MLSGAVNKTEKKLRRLDVALEEVSKNLQMNKITKDNAFDVNIEEQIGLENVKEFLTR